MQLPKKLTKVELEIYKIIIDNFTRKLNCELYLHLSSPIDKIIVYYMYDQGYSLTETCEFISRKRKFVWQRKKIIIKTLQEAYGEKLFDLKKFKIQL